WRTKSLKRRNAPSERTKPRSGEISREPRTLHTSLQSAPAPPTKLFSRATPMRAPISACELELGIPSHHVPTFQNSAEAKTATSMLAAKPPLGGDKTSGGISST